MESLNICTFLVIKLPLKSVLSANLFLGYIGIEKKSLKYKMSLIIRCTINLIAALEEAGEKIKNLHVH